ncbi:venom carboxylesterase-6-like isoform X1 [Daphnia pulicaria]|uniref:venom carboxylesterase-6-like isoform X1 n=2 Tax=Daphnia pulicaria TaxID=35523 RepID=UPI001EEB0538|nr:venom carboxylesterase-6-like isoform X1 [Daphnia pulicaria]
MRALKFQSLFITLLMAILSNFSSAGEQQQQPVVDIPTLGRLVGSQLSSASGRKFHAFRAIPYALPPVGDLRFKDPIPAKSWDEVLDASREGPICTQFNSIMADGFVHGQEDCLYLNVYTPQLKTAGSDRHLLPVMVWIHGGAFYMGSGNGENDRFGPGYILDRDVVLVTFNYRLGPLGFLSTEDVDAPGNYGLLDQSLALRWVRDHVGHFGGDPNSITIFGESAGGASVDFHVLSPYSKGFFHRAIIQSGTAKCPWVLDTPVGEYTKILAEHLDCPTATSSELLQCLRTRSAEDIVGIRRNIALPELGFGMFPMAFVPRIDRERKLPFVPARPEKLIMEKKFNQVPLILGVVRNEGALVSSSFFLSGNRVMQAFKDDPIRTLSFLINMEKRPDGLEMAQLVHDRYLDKQQNYEDQMEQIEQIISDYGLFKCTDDSVNLFSQFNDYPTFYYFYTHRGQFSFPQLVGITPEMDFGVCHADELFLMFTAGYLPLISTPDDVKVSETLLDLWTSFAKDGAPRSHHVDDQWLPVEQGKTRYLNINSQPTFVNDKMPFERRLAFWDRMKVQNRLLLAKDEF